MLFLNDFSKNIRITFHSVIFTYTYKYTSAILATVWNVIFAFWRTLFEINVWEYPSFLYIPYKYKITLFCWHCHVSFTMSSFSFYFMIFYHLDFIWEWNLFINMYFLLFNYSCNVWLQETEIDLILLSSVLCSVSRIFSFSYLKSWPNLCFLGITQWIVTTEFSIKIYFQWCVTLGTFPI